MNNKKRGKSPNLSPLLLNDLIKEANIKKRVSNGPLDTLAQVRKFEGKKSHNKTPLNLENQKINFQKRAKSKCISQAIHFQLLKIEKSPNRNTYQNATNCSSVIIQEGENVKAKYCKTRLCLVCNRIRTANFIKGYMPAFEQMKNPHFITLTVPAVYWSKIHDTTDLMFTHFVQIVDVMRKTHGIRLKAIRNTECNFNPIKKTFNPHFHIVVDLPKDKCMVIVKEWLKRFPNARKGAQNVKQANTESFIELFKYFTKVVSKKSGFQPIAQDKIITAFKGRRLIASYGIKKTIDEQSAFDDLLKQNITFKDSMNEIWVWEQSVFDWVSASGELFSEYTPNKKTRSLLNKIEKAKF